MWPSAMGKEILMTCTCYNSVAFLNNHRLWKRKERTTISSKPIKQGKEDVFGKPSQHKKPH